MPRTQNLPPNEGPFLDLIANSEGTANLGDDGYNILFGGAIFPSYADHPRISVPIPRLGISSTAAGRYQILAREFDAYRVLLSLPDFGPESQDKIALQMIKERRAIMDIQQGNLDKAVMECSNIWASFPGNTYNQPQVKLTHLEQIFKSYGGVIAAPQTQA